MHETTLLRTIRFRARHRYRRPEWSEARNREVFGANVEPHAHDWTLEVAVRGAVDPETGFLVDLVRLDAEIEAVVAPLRDADLDRVLEDAGEVRLPSTENLARWLFERLEGRIPGAARLVRVRLAESPDLASEFSVP